MGALFISITVPITYDAVFTGKYEPLFDLEYSLLLQDPGIFYISRLNEAGDITHPPWTSDTNYFIPLEYPKIKDKNVHYVGETLGFGVDTSCSSPTATQVSKQDVDPTFWENSTLGIIQSNPIYYITPGQLCSPIPDLFPRTEDHSYIHNLSFSGNTQDLIFSPLLERPRSGGSVFGTQTQSFFGKDCAGIFTMSWVRYDMIQRNSSVVAANHESRGFELKVNARQSLICTTSPIFCYHKCGRCDYQLPAT